MDLLKELAEPVRELSWTFLPTPKKKRQEFLEKVREKVGYYKPRIEERCGIGLGDIEVKDNRKLIFDHLHDSYYRHAIENALNQGRFPSELDFMFSFSTVAVAGAASFLPICIYNALRGAEMRFNNNTIYVPFNYMNRFMDPDFKLRERKLDYAVVHEIGGHCLWHKIAGEIDSKEYLFNGGRSWDEGFATYCADDYFADFYPEGAEMMQTRGVYANGKRKIEELVGRYGKDIVLEVPKRWKELSDPEFYKTGAQL